MTVKGDVLLLQLCRLFKCFCVGGGGVFTLKVFDFFVLVSGNQLDLIETKTLNSPKLLLKNFTK